MALVADRERFRIVTAATADFTHHINVRKKIHFDAAEAVPLAGFAAATFHVEAEAAGAVTALPRFRKHGEEIANGRENACVSGGIRARRAADGGLIDLNNFVDVLGAEDFAMRGGRFRGAVEFLRERAIENVVDQSGFSGAGDARDNREHAERKRDVDVLQIVGTGAEDLNDIAVGAAAFFGDGNLGGAAEILAGERFGSGFDLSWFAVGDEVAAGVARARTEVDDKIGAADGFFIVLDDEAGVAEIAKMFKRAEEARVVACVQADARLVEDIENAAEARADLRGQADALGFAAGESGGRAVEAEIAEADGEEELDALGNFFERARGDFLLAIGELREDFADGRPRGAQRKRGEIGNGPSAELDGEGFGAQTLAVADAAERGGHVLRHPLAVGVGAGLFEISFQEFQNAGELETSLELEFLRVGTVFLRGADVWRRIAVQKHILRARGKFLKRRLQIEAVGVGAEFERALQNRGAGARAEAAVEERARPIGDDLGRIEIIFGAEAVARGEIGR